MSPPSRSLDGRIWLLMRYSGIALIPLAWIHVLIQDVLVGVHRINIDYVALRWATLGWRVYDMALLGFAFAHGMNGLRQVLEDYITRDRPRRLVRWGLFAAWLVVTAIGAAAIVGGVGRAAGGASGS
jgi:succinate dehydrogenase / fumarate reductase membrane anchor subunit